MRPETKALSLSLTLVEIASRTGEPLEVVATWVTWGFLPAFRVAGTQGRFLALESDIQAAIAAAQRGMDPSREVHEDFIARLLGCHSLDARNLILKGCFGPERVRPDGRRYVSAYAVSRVVARVASAEPASPTDRLAVGNLAAWGGRRARDARRERHASAAAATRKAAP